MSDDVDGKICSKCKVWKPLGEFYKRGAGNLRPDCKACCRIVGKAWDEANKERRAVTRKAWEEANKERYGASKKAWQEANKERQAAIKKTWYEANKERCGTISKASYEANKEHLKAVCRIYVETLRDEYIKKLLKLRSPTPELIELKREQLKMYRLTKQLQQLLKEKTDGSE